MNDDLLSREDIKALIASYPIFVLLNPDEVTQLALLTKTKHIAPAVQITNEGDIIDNVYFIVSGNAEVTRSLKTVVGDEMIHVTNLVKGDVIGLSNDGFFSLFRQGLRTATVTSTTEMVLVVLSISDLYNFLRESTDNYPDFKKACEKILLINFIKKSDLFNSLSNDRIEQLSRKLTKVFINAKEVIFTQGDKADKCYFILNGSVSIQSLESGHKHVIATLEKSDIFGEGAFLDIPIRNATAQAEKDCELFVYEKSAMDFINEPIAESLNLKWLEQIRPLKNLKILLKEKTTHEGESVLILTNPDINLSRTLSEKEKLIWNHINNNISVLELSNITNIPSKTLYQMLLSFNKNDFIEVPLLKEESFFKKFLKKIKVNDK